MTARIGIVVLMVAAFAQGAAAAPDEAGSWVGTWISESEGVTNVTTLQADGRFRTEHLAGIRTLGATTGRWDLRGNAVRWIYDSAAQDPSSPEDVNPVVLKTPDRFVLRERDGSESRFFRAGRTDPDAPAHLPVAVGAGWVLEDRLGEFAIRVTARETVGGRDCYRVDWIQGDLAYQSEYWFLDAAGVRVAGRRVRGVRMEFAEPYLLLKRALGPGDAWAASLTVGPRTMKLSLSVGPQAEVVTAAGTFQAVPVAMRGDDVDYVRWYAKGVGLVREDVLVGGQPHNSKILRRRLE